jgi:ketosteroid isomerase-like protein
MLRLIVVCLITLCLSALSASAQSLVPTDSAKLAGLRTHIDWSNNKWCEAHKSSDPKLLASLFTDDGGLLLANGQIVQGPLNVETRIGKFMQKYGPFEMTITTEAVWLIDSLGYELGQFTRKSLSTAADVDTTTEHGRYFEIWKERPDGTWRIWRDCGIPKQ